MTENSPDRRAKQAVVWGIARSALLGLGVLAVYWLLPIDSFDSILTIAVMVTFSLGVWLFYVVRELVRLRNSPYPLVRLSGALISTIMLLVVLFAQVFLTLDHAETGSFSEPLTKMAALYFSMTVTATVGFGDIVAKTDIARAIVTFQMFVNLVLLAAALRGLITVAQSHSKPGLLAPPTQPPDAST